MSVTDTGPYTQQQEQHEGESAVQVATPQAVQEDQVRVFTISREDLNKITPQRRYAYVAVNELAPGARARVQSLNSSEISAFEASNYTGFGKKTRLTLENSAARLVAYGWVDEDGKRLYNPREADEVRRIGLMDNAPVARMAEAIREISGMRTEDEDEVEESGNGMKTASA